MANETYGKLGLTCARSASDTSLWLRSLVAEDDGMEEAISTVSTIYLLVGCEDGRDGECDLLCVFNPRFCSVRWENPAALSIVLSGVEGWQVPALSFSS